MKQFLETLKAYIAQHPPNYGDGESVLTMLYECHNENNPYVSIPREIEHRDR